MAWWRACTWVRARRAVRSENLAVMNDCRSRGRGRGLLRGLLRVWRRAGGAGVVGRIGHVVVAEAVEHAVPAGPLPQQVAGGLLVGEPYRAGVGGGETSREVQLGLLVVEGPFGGVGHLLRSEDPGP